MRFLLIILLVRTLPLVIFSYRMFLRLLCCRINSGVYIIHTSGYIFISYVLTIIMQNKLGYIYYTYQWLGMCAFCSQKDYAGQENIRPGFSSPKDCRGKVND